MKDKVMGHEIMALVMVDLAQGNVEEILAAAIQALWTMSKRARDADRSRHILEVARRLVEPMRYHSEQTHLSTDALELVTAEIDRQMAQIGGAR